jgi:hypothetical protein
MPGAQPLSIDRQKEKANRLHFYIKNGLIVLATALTDSLLVLIANVPGHRSRALSKQGRNAQYQIIGLH